MSRSRKSKSNSGVANAGRNRGLLPEREGLPVGGEAHRGKRHFGIIREEGFEAVSPLGFRTHEVVNGGWPEGRGRLRSESGGVKRSKSRRIRYRHSGGRRIFRMGVCTSSGSSHLTGNSLGMILK